MKSFDVFDTLIARRYFKTNSIWQQMSKEFGLSNFEIDRQRPDDGTRSFQEIYNELEQQQLIPSNLKNTLISREIQLEIENCYGIQENLDKVEDGDILISDMYLPAHVILQMVRSAGMNKQVTIYQSNRDKGTGKVWNNLASNPPSVHLGDNEQTDYLNPRKYGIYSELYTKSNYTSQEQFLIKNNLYYIAHLCREVRLSNDVKQYKEYFDIACQYNLPLIFIMCEQLNRSISAPITFLGRDCQLMWRVFNAYYGTSFYMPFSRKIAYHQPDLAAKYVNSNQSKNSVLVDISSTGETWHYMNNYGTFNVKAIIYSDSEPRPYLKNTFSYITKNSVCGQTNLMLEIMNCADHGFLNSLTEIGEGIIKAEFNNIDLPYDIIVATHIPTYDAVDLKQFYYQGIREELNSLTDETLANMFNYLTKQICSKNNMITDLEEFDRKEKIYHEEIISIRKQIK